MKRTTSILALILVLEQLLDVRAEFNKRPDFRASTSSNARNDPKFDFFVFAQTWPPSFFFKQGREEYAKTPCERESDFCIHGLWPNKDDGSYPEYCNRYSTLKRLEVHHLIQIMKQNWTKLSSKFDDDWEFWSHEWERHGTCSESVLDQHAYFKTALELKKEVDLINTLRAKAIEPKSLKDGKRYKISRIKQVIKGKTGHDPIISCISDSNNNKLLYEIWLCVMKAGSKFRDCPNATAKKLEDKEKRYCGADNESIFFPAYEDKKKNKNDELVGSTSVCLSNRWACLATEATDDFYSN